LNIIGGGAGPIFWRASWHIDGNFMVFHNLVVTVISRNILPSQAADKVQFCHLGVGSQSLQIEPRELPLAIAANLADWQIKRSGELGHPSATTAPP
jgi:hypothetical protein